MAWRMQTSIPELNDVSDEPESTFELYGPDSRRPGTYAANCVLARRLIERGVRFVQLFHPDWDHHSRLSSWCTARCRDTDQASAALVKDLKRRGLLEETLVVWGGEFGRGVAGQGKWDSPEGGRDHHPRCFTIWMAGAGVKPGMSYGATDDFSYNVAEDPVDVRDLHATVLNLLGIDHERFTYRFQGLDFKLTGVESARRCQRDSVLINCVLVVIFRCSCPPAIDSKHRLGSSAGVQCGSAEAAPIGTILRQSSRN